jgi:hypothetical protein
MVFRCCLLNLAALVGVMIAGCSPSPSEKGAPPAKDAKSDKTDKGKDAGASAFAIKPIRLVDFDKTIAQHKGKVVLMDIWFNL